LALARSKLLYEVERRQRKLSGFAAGKEVPLECRRACSRFLAKPKEGKNRRWSQVGFAVGKKDLMECRSS